MTVKNTLITAGISVLGTIAIGGVKALQDLTIAAPSAAAYGVPVVQSAADSWWWQLMKWFPIFLLYGAGACGIVLVIAAVRNMGSKVVKAKKIEQPTSNNMNFTVKGRQLMPLETPPIERGFSDGWKKLTRTVIPLGYTKAGEIVTWDVTQAPHIRVHGKTQGSGKTNLIKSIAVCALKAGHHVIVLDRRGFKDWRDFDHHAEMIDNRKSGAFSNTASQLKAFYQKRDEVLGKYGVGNIEELPKKWKRIFVVIAEFGTACREAPEKELEQVVSDLKSIMSESGSTGVHLIYEAQVVNYDWPRELRGNGDPICGYLPEDTSKAGGYSYAYELKPYEFHYDGERFSTWDMKKYAWQLLQTVPVLDRKLITDRSVPFGDGKPDRTVTERSPNGNGTANTLGDSLAFGVRQTFGEQDLSPQNTGNNNFSDRTPNAERSADLRNMVWQWRDKHPDGTQADLRKEFAGLNIDIARGYVHACWHNWVERN